MNWKESISSTTSIEEIASIVAKENKAILPHNDPLLIMVTLCRILQIEANISMAKTQEQFNSDLEEKLLSVEKLSKQREQELMEKALKILDKNGIEQLNEVVDKAKLLLRESVENAFYKAILPSLHKKLNETKIVSYTCLGTSIMILLVNLALSLFK